MVTAAANAGIDVVLFLTDPQDNDEEGEGQGA